MPGRHFARRSRCRHDPGAVSGPDTAVVGGAGSVGDPARPDGGFENTAGGVWFSKPESGATGGELGSW